MNVPKLRFSEFNGEWKKNKLKNLINYIVDNRGKNPEYYTSNGIPVIDNFMIQNTLYPDLSIAKRFIDENIYNNFIRKEILYDDTLITLVGNGIGNICLAPKIKSVIIQNTLGLRPNESINKKFLYYTLFFKNSEIKNLDRGMAQPSIRQDELLKLDVNMPVLNEQLKIANTLELLDKKIELQSQKIEALKLYKKGLLDKLIDNMKIETTVMLNQIGSSYSGLTGKSKEEFEKGNKRYITFMSVLKNTIILDKLPTVLLNENETQNKVKSGDIFFTISSETKDEVGMCSTINHVNEDLYLNSFCFGFRLNNPDEIDNEFLCHMLLSSKYRNEISKLGQGFTRVNLSKKQLLNLKIELPTINEQIKIKTVLNNLTTLINLEMFKLITLNDLKKGLMQNMFV